MAEQKLTDFLQLQCQQRGLSWRRLSLNSGLSAGTVHNIIKREYQPTLFSLNGLADYLGVRREYLWQLAGLLKDMEYDEGTTFRDHQLKLYFTRADRLPKAARMLIISIISVIIAYFEGWNRPGP